MTFRKHTQILNQEDGQATTAALLILPIALALCLGLLLIFMWMTTEAKAIAVCRVSMAKSQKQAANALNQLIALNPKAEALEVKRRSAMAALKAAQLSGQPLLISSATAALAAIHMLQLPLMALQKKLLIIGKTSSRLTIPQATEAVKEALPKYLNSSFSFSKHPQFAVYSSPPDARTPSYRTAPYFRKAQEARMRLLLQMKNPRHLGNAENFEVQTSSSAPSFEIGCAVTVDNRSENKQAGENQWQPQINEDRLLPN